MYLGLTPPATPENTILSQPKCPRSNAVVILALLLGHFGCDSIVFSGVAGGLNPEYNIGDVLIAEQLVQHDYGAIVNGQVISAIPGSFPGMVDENEDVSYKMSLDMRDAIKRTLDDNIRFGRILTGDTYLACSKTREMFHKQFKADAIEMEGGAIAQVCCNWHKPFVVVRVLSDLSGNDSHFDFNEFVDESSAKSAVVVNKLLPVMDAWA